MSVPPAWPVPVMVTRTFPEYSFCVCTANGPPVKGIVTDSLIAQDMAVGAVEMAATVGGTKPGLLSCEDNHTVVAIRTVPMIDERILTGTGIIGTSTSLALNPPPKMPIKSAIPPIPAITASASMLISFWSNEYQHNSAKTHGGKMLDKVETDVQILCSFTLRAKLLVTPVYNTV